jgi:DNA-binding LacI/PurR family transcriptional regulator
MGRGAAEMMLEVLIKKQQKEEEFSSRSVSIKGILYIRESTAALAP